MGKSEIRYISNQDANMDSGDESLKLRARAVLMIHQNPSCYYGDNDGYDVLTPEEKIIMQE